MLCSADRLAQLCQELPGLLHYAPRTTHLRRSIAPLLSPPSILPTLNSAQTVLSSQTASAPSSSTASEKTRHLSYVQSCAQAYGNERDHSGNTQVSDRMSPPLQKTQSAALQETPTLIDQTAVHAEQLSLNKHLVTPEVQLSVFSLLSGNTMGPSSEASKSVSKFVEISSDKKENLKPIDDLLIGAHLLEQLPVCP
ncbi:unnamed protein product [Protopolystoma xenopodis]|uniref:Uncharacterized protein n=1 Tax=Protopolystoma xenopodis TaxID=117903 RepID=A0A448XGI0_9PLAT|nr:unnamed protein product [Protopolystoma xenopodis]